MIKLIAPYKIANTGSATMKDVINFLDNTSYFGIDTEASGNFKLGVFGMNMIMLQIGNEFNQFVIDTRYNDVKVLSKYFNSKRILKIGHNLKFDAQVLKKHGIIMNNIYDTMVSSMSRYTGLDASHSLVACAQRHLGLNIDSAQLDLFIPATSKAIRNTFQYMQYEDFTPAQVFYGAKDVQIACLLKYALEKEIEKEKLTKSLALEDKFALVLADMEYVGIPVNTTKWMNLISKAEDSAIEMEELLNEMISSFSEPINWNSSKQVIKVFKELGIPTQIVDKKSKKGELAFKDSVGAAVIKKYAMRFPIIPIYIRYKEYKKLFTSYGIKFLAKINPVTNRIHSNFIQILVIWDFTK
jgi:DNA polymerase I-like protein with 3'-5' exonuclease and polymerase domains